MTRLTGILIAAIVLASVPAATIADPPAADEQRGLRVGLDINVESDGITLDGYIRLARTAPLTSGVGEGGGAAAPRKDAAASLGVSTRVRAAYLAARAARCVAKSVWMSFANRFAGGRG